MVSPLQPPTTPLPVFIIAEVGSVHDGSLGNAGNLIDAAAECQVDAVKFQTHIASAETLRDAPMPPYFTGEPRYEYFERTAFSLESSRELRGGLVCLNSAARFDKWNRAAVR